MRTLIVEDDFVSRKVLHALLSPHGECDVAVNGKEAVEAFALSHTQGKKYDLVCLDIMMPEMDGQEVLATIRRLEREREIHGGDGVKVVMTTALKDPKNVMRAFREQCDGYLVKPVDRAKLQEVLEDLRLLAT
jgi:two-component system, chemotaxis family, chemotaxis protein CheY